MPLIQCNKLNFGYKETKVIDNFSFNINKGDYVCIVGENGSGKSTLINLLVGILKPHDGTIIFSDEILKNGFGYLPQHSDIKDDFPASVYEVVLSGCANRLKKTPFFTRKDKQIASLNMKLLEITDLKNKSFHNLSGGQKQRVLLARALCTAENTLILDEPVSGLDPMVTEAFYSILNHLNKEHKTTVIMVSHDISSALKYSNHIIHLEKSSSFSGTTDEYLNSEYYKKISGGNYNA